MGKNGAIMLSSIQFNYQSTSSRSSHNLNSKIIFILNKAKLTMAFKLESIEPINKIVISLRKLAIVLEIFSNSCKCLIVLLIFIVRYREL